MKNTNLMKGLTVILAIGFTLSLAGAALAGFQETMLSDSAVKGVYPHISLTLSGTVDVVFTANAGSNYYITYKTKPADSLSFGSDYQATTLTGAFYWPSTAPDPVNDDLHFTYYEKTDNNTRKVHYKLLHRDNTTGDDTIISSKSTGCRFQEMAVDSNNIFVLWQGPNNSGSEQIYYNKTSPSDINWDKDEDKMLSGNLAASQAPAVALSPDGHVFAVYEDYTTANPDIFFKGNTAGWGGMPWQINLTLDNVGAAKNPAIAVDSSSGDIHVVWDNINGTTRNICYKRSTDGGTNFTSFSVLSTVESVTGSISLAPSISTDGNGNVYVIWYGKASGLWELHYTKSSDNGAHFAAEGVLSQAKGRNASLQQYPARTGLAIDRLGNLHAVWSYLPNGSTRNDTVFYSSNALYITAASPSRGIAGTIVMFTGSNFDNGATVYFGDTPVAANVISPSQLTAVVPSIIEGPYAIKIVNPDGGNDIRTGFFTVAEIHAPTITKVTPENGPISTLVTIEGTNFMDKPAVKFDSTTADEVNFISSTKITARVPGLAVGFYDITVTNPDTGTVTANDAFMVIEPADVAVTPSSFTFQAKKGLDSETKQINIMTGGTLPVPWSVRASKPWVKLDRSNGTGTAAINVHGDTSALAENTTYTDNITVEAAGRTFTIPVTFQVLTAPKHTVSGRVTGLYFSNLSGIKITLSGDSSYNTTTDLNGQYSFSNLASGSYKVTPQIIPNYVASPASTNIAFLNTDGDSVADFSFSSPFQSIAGTHNSPNPFNPAKGGTTTIYWEIDGTEQVRIYMYDLSGKLVTKMTVDSPFCQATWDGRDDFGKIVGSGVYLVRIIDTGDNKLIGKCKILVVK